jgi:hypothetical protein
MGILQNMRSHLFIIYRGAMKNLIMLFFAHLSLLQEFLPNVPPNFVKHFARQ